MSFNKIARQLRREATNNPKKAAFLGLLALVALWFWAPLVAAWFRDEEAVVAANNTSPKVAAPAKKAATAEAAGGATTQPQQEVQYPWQDLARWMDSDPRTAVPIAALGPRDPFVPVAPKPVVVPEEDLTNKKAVADMTPESLGMILTSTIVGPQRQVALINGRPYARGKTVRLARDGQPIEFTLAEVHPRSILLERDGQRFELRAPDPTYTGQIELLRDN